MSSRLSATLVAVLLLSVAAPAAASHPALRCTAPDEVIRFTWLLIGGRQHVIFLDPKGIRNLGPTDPKIQFHRTIKEIEQRLGDASVRVQSFIVSNTPSHTMQKLWTMDKPAMAARHILFQDEDQDTYVRSMLEAVGPVDMSTTADAVPS